jgi:ABC-type multidrug transport system ATPase subunit
MSCISRDPSVDPKLNSEEEEEEEEASNSAAHWEAIESVQSKTVGIDIESLHKVYPRGHFHALKGLCVKFYQNEISALLGHNGAGKSTLMHLLTGLYRPTSGSASIDNLNILTDMDRIRKSLGFVPQYNVLFDQMNVEEHLWFYSRLKGLDRRAALEETEKLLNDTNLGVKRDYCALNLSGGQQRRLSVAIAFVGASKTVILDEPSAGVDPSGRRAIWELLLKYRAGRTILISTHHMDEVDVLADRIAIIANGRLVAHGILT